MSEAKKYEGRNYAFEGALRQHIKDTAQPETFAGLSRTKPLKGEAYEIIFQFHLDPTKRPDREMAPCPICSPNAPKYFDGALAWFPAELVYRCIGWECAARYIGKEQADAAKTAYRNRRILDADFEFAFENLGRVPAIIAYFTSLDRVLNDALLTATMLGRSRIRKYLLVATKTDGLLTLWDKRQVERLDPRTSERREVTETVPVVFGRLAGRSALKPNHSLRQRVAVELTRLRALNHGDQVAAQTWVIEHAYDFPEDLRKCRFMLSQAQRTHELCVEQIADILEFFTESNFDQLARFGSDRRNPHRFFATFGMGEYRLGISALQSCRVRPDTNLLRRLPPWPLKID